MDWKRCSAGTSSFARTDFANPYVHQFSLGFQRQLPWRTTVELAYVGSRTLDEQNRWAGFNTPPVSLRDRCDPTKGGSVAFCNELLPNPFFQVPGFEGTTRFTSPDALAIRAEPAVPAIHADHRARSKRWPHLVQLGPVAGQQADVERASPLPAPTPGRR